MKIFRAVGEIYDIAGGMAVGMTYGTKLKQQYNKYCICVLQQVNILFETVQNSCYEKSYMVCIALEEEELHISISFLLFYKGKGIAIIVVLAEGEGGGANSMDS